MKSSQASSQPSHPSQQNRLLGYAERILHPLLPALLAGTIWEAVTLTLVHLGWLSIAHPIYTVLSAIGEGFLYFFPILLAYSLAGRIGCNQPLAILAAAILLHPSLSAWLAGDGGFFGLSIRGVVYPGSLIPVLIMVPTIKWVERLIERFLSGGIKVLLKPVAALSVAILLTVCLVGPLCAYAGNLLTRGIALLDRYANWAAALLLSLAMPLLLLLGGQTLSIPMEERGLWNTALFATAAALLGAAIALLLRIRDRHLRQTAVGASVGTLAGSPYLALYGLCLRQGRILLTVSASAALGGLCAAWMSATEGMSGAPLSAVSLAVSCLKSADHGGEESLSATLTLLIAFLLTAAVSLLLTLAVLPGQSAPAPIAGAKQAADAPGAPHAPIPPPARNSPITVISPLSGQVIPLSQMDDPAFSAGVMGQGCAILPLYGKVYAPAAGTVTSVTSIGNGITFMGADGVQLLIHVGKTDARLSERHFFPCCRAGDRVKSGDLLLSFDIDALRRGGADLTTPLLVINAERYGDLSLTCESRVTAGDRLLTLTPKE